LIWKVSVDPSVYNGSGYACIVLDNRNAAKVQISSSMVGGTINLEDWAKTWTAATPPVGTARAPGGSWNPNIQVRLIDRNQEKCVANSRAAVTATSDGISSGSGTAGFGTQTLRYEYSKSIAKQVNFKTF
jgi:hypothetical protein